MTKITAHSLDIKPKQKLDLPLGARLLTVNVDHRFNKCLLWTAQLEDAPVAEEVTFTMAKMGDETGSGTYVGTFKDNSGYVHVFADKPAKAAAPVAEEAPTKAALAEAVIASVSIRQDAAKRILMEATK